MINNENIVFLANDKWEGNFTSSNVQILSLLAKKNKILFIEYPYTVKDIFTTLFANKKAPILRMLGLKNRIVIKSTKQGTDVIHLVVPPVLPVEFIKIEWLYNLLFKINTLIYLCSLKQALIKYNMQNPICINGYNAHYGNQLIGKLNEKLNIYYCYDGPDIQRFGQKILRIDESFSRKVDGVIVTSDFLALQKYNFNQEVAVVKNGVDFKTFNNYAKHEIKDNSVKVKIGYIGSMDHRFDIDTVEYAIQHLPEYDFYFTGDLRNKSVKLILTKYPNVFFNPPVNSDDVPKLLSNYDIGIIPYTLTEVNKNIYPLKINEYLSIGLPVVLTSFADLPEFNNIVSFTKDKDSFYKAIIHEIESDSLSKINARIEFARNNSWECMAELFGDIIEKLLIKKQRI